MFLDARGDDRALRVTWHSEVGVVVLSLWRDTTCAGSFRLDVADVPVFIDLLRDGLDRAFDTARTTGIVPGMRPYDDVAG